MYKGLKILSVSLCLGSLFACKTMAPNSELSDFASVSLGNTKACNRRAEDLMKLKNRAEQLRETIRLQEMVFDGNNSKEVQAAALTIARAVIELKIEIVDALAREFDSKGLEATIETARVELAQKIGEAYVTALKDPNIRQSVLESLRDMTEEMRSKVAASGNAEEMKAYSLEARGLLQSAELMNKVAATTNDAEAKAEFGSRFIETLSYVVRAEGQSGARFVEGYINNENGEVAQLIKRSIYDVSPETAAAKASLFTSYLGAGQQPPTDVGAAFRQTFDPKTQTLLILSSAAAQAGKYADMMGDGSKGGAVAPRILSEQLRAKAAEAGIARFDLTSIEGRNRASEDIKRIASGNQEFAKRFELMTGKRAGEGKIEGVRAVRSSGPRL